MFKSVMTIFQNCLRLPLLYFLSLFCKCSRWLNSMNWKVIIRNEDLKNQTKSFNEMSFFHFHLVSPKTWATLDLGWPLALK